LAESLQASFDVLMEVLNEARTARKNGKTRGLDLKEDSADCG